jgi:hypothetical protein
MPKSLFLVRAVVAEPLRGNFDHWYSTDHLPWAMKVFKCEKAWRFWSEVEQGVHYAVYQFGDKTGLDTALASEEFKELVADFQPFMAGRRDPDARCRDPDRRSHCAVIRKSFVLRRCRAVLDWKDGRMAT